MEPSPLTTTEKARSAGAAGKTAPVLSQAELFLEVESLQRDFPLQCKIREFRKRRHWTLHKLSQLSGISLITVWRMEHGQGVALGNAFTVAAIFGVSVYELWDIVPPGRSAGMFIRDVTSIRKLRLRRGWGLRELAKASRVSTTTLSVAERGHQPSLENAAKIAAALNVSVYDIWKPPRVHRSVR